jgi:hypothetical protein
MRSAGEYSRDILRRNISVSTGLRIQAHGHGSLSGSPVVPGALLDALIAEKLLVTNNCLRPLRNADIGSAYLLGHLGFDAFVITSF